MGVVLDTQIQIIEKEKREKFLLEKNNIQWQKGLQDAMNVPILQAEYQTKKEQLFLQKTNAIAKKSYKIDSDLEFKIFCREYRIEQYMKKEQTNDKNMLEMVIKDQRKSQKQLQTLEKFIYTLQQEPVRIKQLCKLGPLESIFNTTFNLLGKYQNKYLHVKVFLLYDEEPIFIIILEKEIDQEEIWRLKAQIKTYQHIISKIMSLQQTYQRYSLINIQNLTHQASLSTQQQKQLKYIQCQQYLTYNSILNIKCYLETISKSKQLHHFSLLDLLWKLKQILLPIANENRIKIILEQQKKQNDIKLIQSYWKLFQILFNVLKNAIDASNTYQHINLTFKKKKNQINGQSIIQIKILDKGCGINQKQIDRLPIINPFQLWEYYINYQQKKFKLGLLIASKLLSEIGPSTQIKIKDKLTFKYIKFEIYERLNTMIENKLITANQRFRVDIDFFQEIRPLQQQQSENLLQLPVQE